MGMPQVRVWCAIVSSLPAGRNRDDRADARRSSIPNGLKILEQRQSTTWSYLFKTLGFTKLELTLLRRANPRIISMSTTR